LTPEKLTKLIAKMSVEERIAIAQRKTEALTYHLNAVLKIHENNAFVVYSKTIVGQVPASYAAYALKTLQDTLFQYEIIAICRLWDAPDLAKENITTVAKLISHQAVIEKLAAETASLWISKIDQPFALQQAGKTESDLRSTLSKIDEVCNSQIHSDLPLRFSSRWI
jgi:hypothetical protein